MSYICHILTKFYTLPQSIRRKVYYAYAHPIINYGISIWGLSYKTHIKPLIRLQKSLVKKITFKNDNIAELYKNEKILNIDSLNNYSLACSIHKILSKDAPLLLQEIINNCSLVSNRLTRNSVNNYIRKPAIKLTTMKRSFRWAAPTIYNKIPCHIKNNNFKTFKSRLFSYLLLNQVF